MIRVYLPVFGRNPVTNTMHKILFIESNTTKGWNPVRNSILGMMLIGLSAIGCGRPAFRPNELSSASFVQDPNSPEVIAIAADASRVVESLFGTLDAPRWPEDVAPVVDMEEVQRSAGAVGRAYDKVERGLYRKHCVQCHGVTGDGLGPAAALLAPYPRDFRRGTFKFKSTPIGAKPTKADLVKIVENGIPGTSMPAFSPLKNRKEFAGDIEAMVDYVVFLSVRGEVERRLLREAAESPESLTEESALKFAKTVAESWKQAPETAPPMKDIPTISGDELSASVSRGHELFKSDKTACYKCHGTDGKGDGVSQDFDEWTKDWTIRVGIDPSKKSEWRVMKKFGALKPVVDRSRNLHLGALRGGHTLADLQKRILLGIDGTPMPAAALAPESTVGLNDEEFADLVRYVASITKLSLDPATTTTEVGGRDE